MIKFNPSDHCFENFESIVFRASSKGEISYHRKWGGSSHRKEWGFYAPLKFCGKVIRWIFLWDTHLGRVRDAFIKAHQEDLNNLDLHQSVNYYRNLKDLDLIIHIHNQKWRGWQTTLLFWTRVPQIPDDIFKNIETQIHQRLESSIDFEHPLDQIQEINCYLDRLCKFAEGYRESKWYMRSICRDYLPMMEKVMVKWMNHYCQEIEKLSTHVDPKALLDRIRELHPLKKKLFILRKFDWNNVVEKVYQHLNKKLEEMKTFEIIAELPEIAKTFTGSSSDKEKAWKKEKAWENKVWNFPGDGKFTAQAFLLKTALEQTNMLEGFFQFFKEDSAGSRGCLRSWFNTCLDEKKTYFTGDWFEEKIRKPIQRTIQGAASKGLQDHPFIQDLMKAFSDESVTSFQTLCESEGRLMDEVQSYLKNCDFRSSYTLEKVVQAIPVPKEKLEFCKKTQMITLTEEEEAFFSWFSFIQKEAKQLEKLKDVEEPKKEGELACQNFRDVARSNNYSPPPALLPAFKEMAKRKIKLEDLQVIASIPIGEYKKTFEQGKNVWKALDSAQQQADFPILTFLRARYEMWNEKGLEDKEAPQLTDEEMKALSMFREREGCPEVMQRQIDLIFRSSECQFHPQQICPITFETMSNPVRLELGDRFYYFEKEYLERFINDQFEKWKSAVCSGGWPPLAFKDTVNRVVHDPSRGIKYKNCKSEQVSFQTVGGQFITYDVSIPVPTVCMEVKKLCADFEALTEELPTYDEV